MKMKRIIGVIVGIVVVFGVLGLLVHGIPPTSLTVTRMEMIKRRILQHASAHGSLPADLVDLPIMERHDNSVEDGWRNPITLQVESNTISLVSFGKDGKPGGQGQAADIICRFPAKQPDGSWSPELVSWSEEIIPQWEKN